MQTDEEYLKLLRKINKDPEISQRNLSDELNMSFFEKLIIVLKL